VSQAAKGFLSRVNTTGHEIEELNRKKRMRKRRRTREGKRNGKRKRADKPVNHPYS